MNIQKYEIKLVKAGVVREPLNTQIHIPSEIVKAIFPVFEDSPVEMFVVVALDTANHIIGYCKISEGGLAVSIVEPRRIFQFLFDS